MKTIMVGTVVTLTIVSLSSVASAKEPVPPAGTAGESTNQRLEVIQQHGKQPQLAPQNSSADQLQTSPNSMEQRSTTTLTQSTCLLRPVTAGAMAQRAFANLQACAKGN
ncbi:hypothetical protein LEP3755_63110 (plasmid) [Leptolyngbya sp. NIES-3755]|nr:hypothetical protein LEP3755_63110 [Leptolyngbya sp. NIES-3755]